MFTETELKSNSIAEEGREQTLDVDCLFDGFVKVNEGGLVTAWNLQAEVMFGWSRSEALGRPASQLIVPPRNRLLFEQMQRQLLVAGEDSAQKLRTQITALHREGQEFEIELILFPMPSARAEGLGIFARQLTQRKFSEVELRERHHALMDQLGECYAEMDLRGKITFVNNAYCEIFGVSRENREGANYKGIFTPEVAELFRQSYGRVYQTGRPAKIDYSLKLQSGKDAFNEQSVSLMRDPQGNPSGFMVIVRDCFERKQNELELLRAKQAAETASRTKGEFLANMSHEIRTPLNGVMGMLELIGYTKPTSEQRELLETAQSAAQNLLAVINDILDFSKIEAGKLEIDHTEFNLPEAVAETIGVMRITAQKKGLELIPELAPGVPNRVLGDPTRLKQVMLNLIGNAVKFTQYGEVKVRAQVEAINGGKLELKVSVIDSGIGIPVEKQNAIFEAFSQADASTTRKFGGTGLGLTISSRLVKLMGGKIWVESEVGKGSTFSFTATLEVAGSTSPKLVDLAATQAKPAPSDELRILLAEDNSVNQKLAVRLLEKLGHRVVVASNGIEALSKLADQQFDLVMMDVQMPEMDGFAATAAIRAIEEAGSGARMPVIAMTAHAMKGDRERCLEAGMDDYIAKPISAKTISEVIDRVLKDRSEKLVIG